ncbi:unnamed protein product, partial [Didymodactylos carnosus]
MPTDRIHVFNSEYRKNTKPIMEKRRRERINRSLEELKNLILDSASSGNVRSHKLEKADILEMTVKHLKLVHKQKLVAAAAVDPSIISKYRSGYGECANEIIRFLTTTSHIDSELKNKLIDHLSTRIQTLSTSRLTDHNNTNNNNQVHHVPLSTTHVLQHHLQQQQQCQYYTSPPSIYGTTKNSTYCQTQPHHHSSELYIGGRENYSLLAANSSTNNQYIFILPQTDSTANSSDCSNSTDSCSTLDSPSKVWRP